ncbi:MAG: AtuA-related protein [Dongiaceae bacterium]
MARVKLMEIAIARSGDKGAGSNVGVMAKSPEAYEFLRKELTVERVKAHFREINFGKVDRYELPNLRALNFILHDSLGGGGTETQKTDAQGKVHGLAMLHLELDVPDHLLS